MIQKILLSFALLATLTGCSSQPEKWEYKVLELTSENPAEKFMPSRFQNPTDMLNVMGQNGWELVDTYTDVHTVFPNFGNEQYLNGIRENARTSAVHFVFKRPLKETKK